MENNEKSYILENPESLTKGLGVTANAKHTISIVGHKTAAFTDRIKKAITTNYNKAISAIKNKFNDIKTGVVNTATHISNSADAHAYHLAQEDYQKIMNKKTANLDTKIEAIRNKITNISSATIGNEKGQVTSEKERTYLLHKSSKLLENYTNEKSAIVREANALENYEKGQNAKIKVAAKRRILIGALDLKRIVTNVAKATKNAGKSIANGASNIAHAAGNSMNRMQEKMLERKVLREEEKARLREANMTPQEVFEDLSYEEGLAIDEYFNLDDEQTKILVDAYNKNIGINNKKEEIKEQYPKAIAFAESQIKNNISEPEMKIRNIADKAYEGLHNTLMKNPLAEENKHLLKRYQYMNEREEQKLATEKMVAANEAYERGKEAGKAETANEINDLKKQIEELQKQINNITKDDKKETKKEAPDYSSMTKDELLKEAKGAGLDVKASMKKADIIDSLSKSELVSLRDKVTSNKKK